MAVSVRDLPGVLRAGNPSERDVKFCYYIIMIGRVFED